MNPPNEIVREFDEWLQKAKAENAALRQQVEVKELEKAHIRICIADLQRQLHEFEQQVEALTKANKEAEAEFLKEHEQVERITADRALIKQQQETASNNARHYANISLNLERQLAERAEQIAGLQKSLSLCGESLGQQMEKLAAAEALVAQADKYGEDGWDRAERYAAERDAARAALRELCEHPIVNEVLKAPSIRAKVEAALSGVPAAKEAPCQTK